jgi:hypothetical protein
MHRVAGLVFVALFLSLLSAPSGHAAGDPDEAAMRAYTLSMDKLNRFAAGVQAFEKAAETDDTLEAEREAMEELPSDSFAEKRAQYMKHPRIFGFFQQQGLSLDDIVVGLNAAGMALAAVSQPGADAALGHVVSPAQLQFARQNQAALAAFFEMIGR